MGATDISTSLTWLAIERHVSASTQNQALSALLFLCKDVRGIDVGRLDAVPRARLPIRVPVVISREEVSGVLKHLPFALARKYPKASTDWAWQFVFPAARIYLHVLNRGALGVRSLVDRL